MAEEYALALGVTRVHLLAGRAPDDDQTRPAYRRSVAWAAERFGEHGIQLLIEPVNARDHPGYFLTDFHVARSEARRVGKDVCSTSKSRWSPNPTKKTKKD